MDPLGGGGGVTVVLADSGTDKALLCAGNPWNMNLNLSNDPKLSTLKKMDASLVLNHPKSPTLWIPSHRSWDERKRSASRRAQIENFKYFKHP
jgi:hypothetical protein